MYILTEQQTLTLRQHKLNLMKCPAIFVKASSITLAVYIPHASTNNTNFHILSVQHWTCFIIFLSLCIFFYTMLLTSVIFYKTFNYKFSMINVLQRQCRQHPLFNWIPNKFPATQSSAALTPPGVSKHAHTCQVYIFLHARAL